MTPRNNRAPRPGLDSREGLTVQVPVLSWNLTRERYQGDGSRQASRSVEAHPSRSYPRSTARTLAGSRKREISQGDRSGGASIRRGAPPPETMKPAPAGIGMVRFPPRGEEGAWTDGALSDLEDVRGA